MSEQCDTFEIPWGGKIVFNYEELTPRLKTIARDVIHGNRENGLKSIIAKLSSMGFLFKISERWEHIEPTITIGYLIIRLKKND